MTEEKAREEKAALLLADISGYTKFVRLHRLSLLHAQAIITGLLESVIDSARSPLQVNKLEGDCVFFYAPSPEGEPEVLSECASQTLQLLSAFQAARDSFKSGNI